jgi:glycosyltransferase involved in cell wall biosynthesis
MNDYVVVIPTRNRYRLCLRAIRSALTQTVPPAEVFVVDDASDDPRYQWLEEIVGSPRLTVLRRAVSSREETGAGFAVGTVRNEAIRHVLKIGFSGWVAFLDDDDEWIGTKAAVQFAAVGSNGRYGVLCSNAFNRDIGGVVSGYHHEKQGVQITDTTRDVTAICRATNPVINSTAMIHSKIVERLGDQQAVGFGEDWDYWQRASRLTGIMRVEEPLAWYTVGNPKEYTL